MNALDAVIEINPGAGGPESQHAATLLANMYNTWAAKQGLQHSYQLVGVIGMGVVRHLIVIDGAYDRLRQESGVHRIVRTPPEDERRHTSFASVFVFGGMEAYEARHDEQVGEDNTLDWSSQVRSYVFNPPEVAHAKDHRSGLKIDDVMSVISGGTGLSRLLDSLA